MYSVISFATTDLYLQQLISVPMRYAN